MNPDLLAKIQAAMDAQFKAGYTTALMQEALTSILPTPVPSAEETPETTATDAA